MRVLAILTGAMLYDGITNSVYNYYAAMDKTDIQIEIVSARSTMPEIKKKFENIGCVVHQLEYRDKNPIKYFFKLTLLIRKNKYDIVHSHGNSATLAFETTAALFGGAKVRIVHSRNSSCEHKTIDKLLRPIMYATYTDGFACGKKAGEWLFNKKPFTVVNNGKDIDSFLYNSNARKDYRKKLAASDSEILLGHVGLFHKQKNHDFLIDIFYEVCKKSEQYKLILIGEGEEQERIREKVFAKGLSDKVVFLGRQGNVHEWLQALDIMVFPSKFEGMPNVVLEWQIAGLPALISDNITRECKVLDTIEYFSIDKSAEQWAEKIMGIRVEEREGKQERIKQKFREAGFDILSNADMLKKTYQDLVDKRKYK